jgi:hypothetical protein
MAGIWQSWGTKLNDMALYMQAGWSNFNMRFPTQFPAAAHRTMITK